MRKPQKRRICLGQDTLELNLAPQPQLRRLRSGCGVAIVAGLELADRARELDPMVEIVESTRGNALRELGRYDDAKAEFLTKETVLGQPMFGLAMTYAKMGKRTEALQVIHALKAREKKTWVEPTWFAFMYAAMQFAVRAACLMNNPIRSERHPTVARLMSDRRGDQLKV